MKSNKGKGGKLLECHNAHSAQVIKNILDWFRERTDNNRVYTFYSERENKDVYMIALRDTMGELIGYYEKHEYRNRETGRMYEI